MSQAAKALGVKRPTLINRINELEIDVEDFKDSITVDEPVVYLKSKAPVGVNPNSMLRRVMLEYTMGVLTDFYGNRTHAAQELGVSLRSMRNFCAEAKAQGIPVHPSPKEKYQ